MRTPPKVTKVSAKTDPVGKEMQKTEPTVKITLTPIQFNTIMAGLGELPNKLVANLIPERVKQVQSQVKQPKTK